MAIFADDGNICAQDLKSAEIKSEGGAPVVVRWRPGRQDTEAPVYMGKGWHDERQRWCDKRQRCRWTRDGSTRGWKAEAPEDRKQRHKWL
jgi:hypothetical protein